MVMDEIVSVEQLSQLWDDYAGAVKRYEAAKEATDVAEAARDTACQACESAYRAWEAACADEVRYGRSVRDAAVAFQAASDAAFLTECGIKPSSLLPR